MNFYYLIIFGGFDQLALIVSQILKLGLPERNVGAIYQSFLDALETTSTTLRAIVTKTAHTDFVKRIGGLRHLVSHRGSVMPGKLYERPDREATDENSPKEGSSLNWSTFYDFAE